MKNIYYRSFEKSRLLWGRYMIVFMLGLLYLVPTGLFGQKEELKRLKQELLEVQSDSQKVSQLIKLSRAIHREEHNEREEYKYAMIAVELGLKTDTLLYAKALDNLGLLYRYHQWYSQAIPLHIKAYQLLEGIGETPRKHLIRYANNAGVAARYDQQYDLAMEYYLNALRIATAENDIKNIAISSNGIGNVLSEIPGKENEAMVYFEQALKAERIKNDSLGIAMDLLSIGDHYIKLGEFKTARRYLDTLLTINSRRNDEYGLAITDQFYGLSYMHENKNLKKAETYFQQALHKFTKLKSTNKKSELYQSLGKLYQLRNDSRTAVKFYQKSIRLAEETRNKSLISQSAYALAEINEERGDYKNALIFFQKGKAYEDSIKLSGQKIKVAALTNHYKLEQKEAKIASLQTENALRTELVNEQKEKIKTHRIYFGVLILVLLLVLAFIYIQRKTTLAKNRAITLLHNKQEELLRTRYEKSIVQAEMVAARSQLNPHFLFNCLTGVHLLLQKREAKKADEYLICLSRFLRRVLELPSSSTISLVEELDIINHYVTLEKIRFDDGFKFNVNSPSNEELKQIKIPPLILQPFVENAIRHGLLLSSKYEKMLQINIQKDSNELVIHILDNGVGRNSGANTEDDAKRKSLGMQITKERIEYFNKISQAQIAFFVHDRRDESTGKSTGTEICMKITE